MAAGCKEKLALLYSVMAAQAFYDALDIFSKKKKKKKFTLFCL